MTWCSRSAKSCKARSNALRAGEPRPLVFARCAGSRLHLGPQLLVAAAADFGPLAPQRRHHHRLDEHDNVLAAGVVGADERFLAGVEVPLEERAEDRRLDVRPVVSVERSQDVDLRLGQRHGVVIGEQAAVEAGDRLRAEIAPFGHRAEEVLQPRG